MAAFVPVQFAGVHSSPARVSHPSGVAQVVGSGASKASFDDWSSSSTSTLCLGIGFLGGVATRITRRGYDRGGPQLSQGEIKVLSDAKNAREDDMFKQAQQSYEARGVPPVGAARWAAEERRLFSNQMAAGINFKKFDVIPVETEAGQGTEKVIESFQEACDMFDLHPDLTDNIKRCGYSTPTPVQKHSIPAVLGGSDVMVTAQTGSGKTAAFLVPIIATALKAGPKAFRKGPARPTSVVLSPTRELCQQIAMEARKLCFKSSCRVVEIYGGSGTSTNQVRSLSQGCEIIVCTPGRLKDFMNRGFISMEEVKFLALDEADRMLDMGFEPDIREIVEDSGMPAPGIGDEGRQTMMFSATFPQTMQDMALDYLHPAYYMIRVGKVGATHSDVEQRFVDASEHWDKFEMLSDVVKKVKNDDGEVAKTIVFVNQKKNASYITDQLLKQGIKACQVHGDIDQMQRNQAISDLRAGRMQVLVATDVAARGLDLPGVAHVVNFDLPGNAEDYVHRIGRTGRIGNKGIATSLVGKNESSLRDIVKGLKESKAAYPDWLDQMA